MGILSKIFGIFKSSPKQAQASKDMDPRDVPAHLWPEVQTFIEELRDIVDKNTIDDKQAKRMNTQIMDYLANQIEKKGYSGTYEDKCQAMEIIADRVLTTTVPKLVGSVEQTEQKTEFSDVVNKFKSDLEKKKQALSSL